MTYEAAGHWVQLTSGLKVEQREDECESYLVAFQTVPTGPSWKLHGLLVTGSDGTLKIVRLDDIRVPPAWVQP